MHALSRRVKPKALYALGLIGAEIDLARATSFVLRNRVICHT
jgi:hypothetical protein